MAVSCRQCHMEPWWSGATAEPLYILQVCHYGWLWLNWKSLQSGSSPGAEIYGVKGVEGPLIKDVNLPNVKGLPTVTDFRTVCISSLNHNRTNTWKTATHFSARHLDLQLPVQTEICRSGPVDLWFGDDCQYIFSPAEKKTKTNKHAELQRADPGTKESHGY